MAGLAVFVRKRRRLAAEKAPEFAAGEYGDSELMHADLICARMVFELPHAMASLQANSRSSESVE